ncbi:DUF6233 domain-containing protein [Streptomyces sp. GLT-R25]
MLDDLPPDLGRLHALRVWHAMWLQRIDDKIAALQKREAERERGQRARPAEPEWIVELGIGDGRPPAEVHVGGCYAAGKRRRPVGRDEARRLLASGVRAWQPLPARHRPGHPRLTRPTGPLHKRPLNGPAPPATFTAPHPPSPRTGCPR